MHRYVQILVAFSSFYALQCYNISIGNAVPYIPTISQLTTGLLSSTEPIPDVTTEPISNNSESSGLSVGRELIPYRTTTTNSTYNHATTTYLTTSVTTDLVHDGTTSKRPLVLPDVPHFTMSSNFGNVVVTATQPLNELNRDANFVDNENVSDIKQMKSLLESLFHQYDKRVRPKHDQSQPLMVQSTFVPHTFVELNTQQQTFTVNGYFKIHWTDELLQWDSEEYDLKKNIRVPANLIWIPRIKIAKVLNN